MSKEPFEIIILVCGHDYATNVGWAEKGKTVKCVLCGERKEIKKVIK